MHDLTNALTVSASGMKAQSTRLRYTAENIANVDTPGYRRKLTTFESTNSSETKISQVKAGKVRLDQSELPSIFDPSHPLADDQGNYDGSNVNLLIEMTDASQAQRSYEANVKIFDHARQMSTSLLDLLRR